MSNKEDRAKEYRLKANFNTERYLEGGSNIEKAYIAGWDACEAESTDYWHQKYLDKVAELDKALDFIVEREKDGDYICVQLNENYDEFQKCVTGCRNLNKDCVLRFLKHYNKEE